MLIARDVQSDARKIFGIKDDVELFTRITDAVKLLANKGEIDPLVGLVDLCVSERCFALPREVETILALNIGGRPALGRDELFSFHLNGMGDFQRSCREWTNVGAFPTYRDISCPSKLVAFVDREEDAGVELRVFGYDHSGAPLTTIENGVPVPGHLVPTIFGYALPDYNAPKVARITSIRKGISQGVIRLSSLDNSDGSGTLLGVFEPDEIEPRYRRVRIGSDASWVRLAYRKRSVDVTSWNSRILLHSRLALTLALRAIKKYGEEDLPSALAFEAQATRILTEQESVLTSITTTPLQVDIATTLQLGGHDRID